MRGILLIYFVGLPLLAQIRKQLNAPMPLEVLLQLKLSSSSTPGENAHSLFRISALSVGNVASGDGRKSMFACSARVFFGPTSKLG